MKTLTELEKKEHKITFRLGSILNARFELAVQRSKKSKSQVWRSLAERFCEEMEV